MTDSFPLPLMLREELRLLQEQVDLAFAEPEYVDTGDLINALDQATDILHRLTGVAITKPDHDAED